MTKWHGRNASKPKKGTKNGLKKEKPTIRQDMAKKESKPQRRRLRDPFTPQKAKNEQ